MEERTTFGLYGSTQFLDRAMFLKLNHRADLIIVPRFPGLEILSRNSHLLTVKFNFISFDRKHNANMPEGDFVCDKYSSSFFGNSLKGIFKLFALLIISLFFDIKDLEK